MKEQGKDFDPLKEPVQNETIRGIVDECHRIFDFKLPLLEEDIPIERELRIGYTEDGELIDVYHDGEFTFLPNEGSTRIFSIRNKGENTYSISLHENFTNKKLVDLSDVIDLEDYDDSHDKGELLSSEVLSYTYVVDSDGKDTFMQLFVTPKAWIEERRSAERLTSSLQVRRTEELISEGFPVGSLNISAIMKDPISNPIIPSEEIAKRLLEFMRKITRVERFSPGPFM